MKQRLTVLVADDVATNRLAVRRVLRNEDFTVIEASGGQDALEKLKQEDIDIALLDVIMPDLDGFAVCRELRKSATAAELPVLFITGKTEDRDLAEGFAAGGNDYITKPINKTVLLARLNAQVQFLQATRALSETYATLARKKRMETIGTFAGAMAHNFNNFLGTIMGSAEFIQIASNGYSGIQESTELIISAANRGAELVESLLTFSLTPDDDCCPNPNEIVKSAFSLLDSINKGKATVESDVAENLPPLCISTENLSLLLIEILKNSLEAIEQKGKISLSAKLPVKSDNDSSMATFLIRDTGRGIDPKIVDHIFEPFYSTKNVHCDSAISIDGAGLGLSMVHNLLNQAGGSIEIAETSEEGTTVKIMIPLAENSA